MKRNITLLLGLMLVFAISVIAGQQLSDRLIAERQPAWVGGASDLYNLSVVFKPYEYGNKIECKGMWHEGITAAEATMKCGEASGVEIKTAVYGDENSTLSGELIEEILGLKNMDHNRFWLFYVNGKFVVLAAKELLAERNSEADPFKFYLKPGDRLEWRFEEWITLEEEQAR